jgi:hypothetical protein
MNLIKKIKATIQKKKIKKNRKIGRTSKKCGEPALPTGRTFP